MHFCHSRHLAVNSPLNGGLACHKAQKDSDEEKNLEKKADTQSAPEGIVLEYDNQADRLVPLDRQQEAEIGPNRDPLDCHLNDPAGMPV